jgi:hypothetical protein
VERLRGWFAQSGQRGGLYNDRERNTMAYGRAGAAAINQCKDEHFLNKVVIQYNSSIHYTYYTKKKI